MEKNCSWRFKKLCALKKMRGKENTMHCEGRSVKETGAKKE
jgi:hypothetical protein